METMMFGCLLCNRPSFAHAQRNRAHHFYGVCYPSACNRPCQNFNHMKYDAKRNWWLFSHCLFRKQHKCWTRLNLHRKKMQERKQLVHMKIMMFILKRGREVLHRYLPLQHTDYGPFQHAQCTQHCNLIAVIIVLDDAVCVLSAHCFASIA